MTHNRGVRRDSRRRSTGGRVPLAASAALVLLTLGCSPPETAEEVEAREAAEESAQLVAEIDGRPVTLGEFEASLESLPHFVRQGADGDAGRKRLFADYLSLEVLADEGERRGYHRDPRVIRRVQQTLVEHWATDPSWWEQYGDEVSDEEVEAHFDAHPERFRTPTRADLAWVEFRSADGAHTAHGAIVWATAAIRGAGSKPPDADALLSAVAFVDDENAPAHRERTVVQRRTESADTSDEALAALVGAAVAHPEELGGVRFHALADGPGFVYITRSIEPGRVPDFDSVSPMVMQDLLTERRDAAQVEGFDELVEEATIEILDPELEGATTFILRSPKDGT